VSGVELRTLYEDQDSAYRLRQVNGASMGTVHFVVRNVVSSFCILPLSAVQNPLSNVSFLSFKNYKDSVIYGIMPEGTAVLSDPFLLEHHTKKGRKPKCCMKRTKLRTSLPSRVPLYQNLNYMRWDLFFPSLSTLQQSSVTV